MKKLILIITLFTLSGCVYSDGERAGQVVKLSRKGWIFKTYEGELATLAKGQLGTMVSNTFVFSVPDRKVASDIQDAMNQGKSVSLHYEQHFWAWFWEGNTKYFITKVSVNN